MFTKVKSQPRTNEVRRSWLPANPNDSQTFMILFQAQIAEHQQLAEHYRELAAKREALVAGLTAVQQQADSDLTSLKLLVDKCKELAPSTIASLKNAVLNLFDSGDDGNDGGNQPTDPTPQPDDDEPELLCLNGETGEALTTADIAADHPHKAELNGQAYEWSSPFASPLVCLLEDAPLLGQHCQLTSHWEHDWELEPLDGQAWEIATPLCCLLSDVPKHNKDKGTDDAESMAYIELVSHPENKAIAYQRRRDYLHLRRIPYQGDSTKLDALRRGSHKRRGTSLLQANARV